MRPSHLVAASLLAAVPTIGCTMPQAGGETEARRLVTAGAEERGAAEPDEQRFVELLRDRLPHAPGDVDDQADRGFVGCVALDEGREHQWAQVMLDDGYAPEDAEVLLAVAITTLCPWHAGPERPPTEAPELDSPERA